jgi:hypothetical protein
MVALAVPAVVVLLAVAFFWWFRRTPMYRANRATGVVPGQWSALSAPRAHGVGGTPPPRPVLRADGDPPPPPTGRTTNAQGNPPGPNDSA